tara:strand:+ start:86 stop:625 length:540 start_codon:yes stop_codon:yes gene_type:complete
MNSEDRYLKDLLSGKTPEKRVMVGFEGKKQKSGDKVSRLSEIMAEARMPWFCPKCKKIMKKNADNKMWMYFGHCLECQVEEEHNMRVNGTFEEFAEKKVITSKIDMIKDQIVQINEWKSQKSFDNVEPVNIDTGFVHIEKNELTPSMIKEAEDAVVLLEEKLVEFETRLKEIQDAERPN